MSFSKFLLSRKFLKHLLMAGILIIAILFLVMQGLKMYTRHGQSNPVPNFSGLTQAEARQTANQYKLEVEIVDSLYVNDAASGAIVDQLPKAGSRVKENRTIFLTINSTQPEQVILPKLTDVSFRQAQVLIENTGLKTGQISYRPSEYNDLVLEVQKDSIELAVGEKLAKGTTIDLVVGRTQGNQVTNLPNLIGLTIPDARESLTDARLNTGVIIYDASVLSPQDSTEARVWRQQPNPKVTGTANLGSSVDLWVTVDQLKIDDATEFDF
ncbi:PASTA domain, binds beta-lactams [Tangfeifania diversioriginum]|uniref:PASTA domain, binds beta-lactams n=1 Tax=Tangfeifania diversioriginum TaxID=1168035 RepID=A0A1M6HUH4_9BACT|nr:PASTA domain-containing protein [Tangfeifania diversioriginum]SHJ25876.1 PASTA domain, binds beta-lactams [Tangfeifania diversioriginum]